MTDTPRTERLARVWPGGYGWHEEADCDGGWREHVHLRSAPAIVFLDEPLRALDGGTITDADVKHVRNVRAEAAAGPRDEGLRDAARAFLVHVAEDWSNGSDCDAQCKEADNLRAAIEAEAAAGPRDEGLREALELDIRELRGAEPAELARRLVERGWTQAAGPRDDFHCAGCDGHDVDLAKASE